MEMRIKEAIEKLVKNDAHFDDTGVDDEDEFNDGSAAGDSDVGGDENGAAAIKKEDILISRDVFNIWLQDAEMMACLEEVDIETSTRFELFDVLDADGGGELSFGELVSGLMR